MAEAERPTSLSFLSGDKKIPTLSFYGYLAGGIVADVFLCDWMPGAGTMFVLFCRGMYLLNGYKTDKMMTTTLANAVAGFIPIVADFTTIIFIVSSYTINKAETKADADAALAAVQQMAKRGARRTGNRPGTTAAANTNQPHIDTGQRNIRDGSANRPTTAADKNIGLQNTERGNAREPGTPDRRDVGVGTQKNVDGVRPPEKPYVPTQPVFRQPTAANDNAGTTKHAA